MGICNLFYYLALHTFPGRSDPLSLWGFYQKEFFKLFKIFGDILGDICRGLSSDLCFYQGYKCRISALSFLLPCRHYFPARICDKSSKPALKGDPKTDIGRKAQGDRFDPLNFQLIIQTVVGIQDIFPVKEIKKRKSGCCLYTPAYIEII